MKALFKPILIILFFGFASLQAQEPLFRKYGIAEGLPSNEVYQIRFDSKGYLWIATDRGVSRFNGSEFINYDQQNGLEDITVFNLREDNKGRMWAASWAGSLFYFENDSFHAFARNDSLQKVIGGHIINDMIIDDDRVWVSTATAGILRIDSSGKNYVLKNKRVSIVSTVAREIRPNKWLVNKKHCAKCSIDFEVIGLQGSIYYPNLLTYCSSMAKVSIDKLKNGDVLAAFCNQVFVFKEDGTYRQLSYSFYTANAAIFEDEEGYVWIGSQNGGVRKFNSLNNYEMTAHYLQGYSVSFIEKGIEGGIWLSTLEEGLMYMPSPKIHSYRVKNKNGQKLKDMIVCQDTLYVGTAKKGVFPITHSKEGKWSVEQALNDFKFKNLTSLGCVQNELLVSTNFEVYGEVNKHFKPLNSFSRGGHLTSGPGNFFSAFARFEEYDSTYNMVNSISLNRKRIRCIEDDKNGNVWLGGNDGLNRYRKNSPSSINNPPILNIRIMDIEADEKGLVYAATMGNGVVVLNSTGVVVNAIDHKAGLTSDNTTAILKQSSGDLWIATLKGLCHLLLQEDGKYQLAKVYTSKDGIVEGEIKNIIEYKESIWILTPTGISSIPLDGKYVNDFSPSIHISAVKLLNKDSVVSFQDTVFSYDENDFAIEFEGISYKNAFNVSYSYRLLGLDSNYQTTSDNHVQYIALQPGNYTFEVRTFNHDGMPSLAPARWSFSIESPIWERTWFIVLISFLILVIVLSLIFIRDRTRNRRQALELAVLENEQKAVTAQINPHFIYNAMNSVQYHVLENRPEVAADQLAKFSELMRKVLSNTKSSFITLASEIDILKLYLSLEQERFEGKFEYHLDIDSKLRPEAIAIPSMVIQPHIENALWHGLLKKEGGSRQLHLSLKSLKDELTWTIVDNGVGREASQTRKTKKDGYTSSGIELTQKRLKLLHQQSGKPYSIEIEDLKDENNKPLGTRVIVKMFKRTIQS